MTHLISSQDQLMVLAFCALHATAGADFAQPAHQLPHSITQAPIQLWLYAQLIQGLEGCQHIFQRPQLNLCAGCLPAQQAFAVSLTWR